MLSCAPARVQVVVEREVFEEEKEEEMNQASEFVKVNARGVIIHLFRSTLCLVSDSLLVAMFSGRWQGCLIKNEDGADLSGSQS